MINHLKNLARSPRLLWVLIGVGILLRLVHYLHNCSFSVDESALALNILGRSYGELFEPLDNNQGTPLGFLLLLKSIILAFNESEYAFRFIAFISGVISLFLFKSLATRYLTPSGVPVAMGLFAFAHYMIFYSAQAKQYSCDVMIALVLYLVTDYVRTKKPTWSLMLLFGMVGAAALWFSHPAIFILAGIALSLTYFTLIKAGRTRRFGVVIAFAIWAVTFTGIYFLFLRKLANHEWLHSFWSDGFMPLPPTSMVEIKWFIVSYFKMFTKTLGFSLKGLCGVTVLLGGYSLFSSNRERLSNLVLPIMLVLMASGFQQYPFRGRLILFTAPALLLLMAEGTAFITSVTRTRPVVGFTVITLLFLHPVMWAGYHLTHPRYEEEIKPALSFMEKNRQPDDIIYVYYGALPAFTYYSERYGFDREQHCVVGVRSRDDWNRYREDLEKLRGHKRVWIVFAHIYDWGKVDDEVLFLHFLDKLGKRLDSHKSFRASAYLYDLSYTEVATGTDGRHALSSISSCSSLSLVAEKP